jgi:hypothetical protein
MSTAFLQLCRSSCPQLCESCSLPGNRQSSSWRHVAQCASEVPKESKLSKLSEASKASARTSSVKGAMAL